MYGQCMGNVWEMCEQCVGNCFTFGPTQLSPWKGYSIHHKILDSFLVEERRKELQSWMMHITYNIHQYERTGFKS